MKWMQNQGRMKVVERAMNENKRARSRLPRKTTVLAVLVMFWGLMWLGSMLTYFVRSRFASSDVKSHDHSALRKTSPLLKELKRPLLHGRCFFHPQDPPEFGYIGAPCVASRSCIFRETLVEAQEACLLSSTCRGVTFIPWEERYELREEPDVHETFDQQRSYVKNCDS